jgi:hypothetical protein
MKFIYNFFSVKLRSCFSVEIIKDTSRLYLLLPLIIVSFSCSKKALDSSVHYFAYKPYITQQNGRSSLYWKVCQDWSKQNLDHIPEYFYVRWDGNTVVKDAVNGSTDFYVPTNTTPELISIKDYRDYVSGKIRGFYRYRYPADALNEDLVPNQYAWFRDYALGKNCSDYSCLADDQTFIQKLNNCDAPSAVVNVQTCPTILKKFDTSVLINTSLSNTSLTCTYPNKYIYPSIKAGLYDSNCGTDYVLDINKDLMNRRFAFINVDIKGVLNPLKEYFVECTPPSGKKFTINLKNNVPHPDTLVFCNQDNSFKKYVLKLRLNNPGNYILKLFNWDEINTNPNAFPVETCSFDVFSVDDYSVDNITLSSASRTLNLVPLSIPGMPSITTCKVSSRASFAETLKDAFSLNEKNDLTKLPLSENTIQEGIRFNIAVPNGFAQKYFDQNGNIKLKKSIVREYNKPPTSLATAYKYAVMETYFRIYNDYPDKNTKNTTLIFYANGGILVNDDYTPCNTLDPTNIDLTAPELFSPKFSLFSSDKLQGLSGPVVDGYPKIDNVTICGVFKQALFVGSLSYESFASIVMCHEIGHSWGQKQMVYKFDSDNDENGVPISDTERHNHFCSGSNKEDCVFRYYSNTSILQNKYAQHDRYGIIWCESHRQIYLNQLMRKY